MRKANRRLITAFIALFAFIAPQATSANPPKAGATCSKAGSTQTYSGKKFTCVKSGTKLIWDKGVVIPSAKPSISPTPSPTASSSESGSGTQVKPTPTPSPSSKPNAPTAGTSCSKLGDRLKNSQGVLECRYVKGKKLVFIQLSETPPAFTNPKSAQDVSLCKLKGQNLGNALTGFGIDITLEGEVGRLNPRVNPAVGVNDMLVVPFDFPDLQGEAGIKDRITSNRTQFIKWVDYFSSGKLKVNVDYVDHWVRMPKNASYYDKIDYSLSTGHDQFEITRIAQLFFDTLTLQMDLTKYRTILALFPLGQEVIHVDLVPRTTEFTLKEGKRQMSFFADPAGYDTVMETPPWAFWIHELGHDWGLLGHAPGNGWPVGVMTNQAEIGRAHV